MDRTDGRLLWMAVGVLHIALAVVTVGMHLDFKAVRTRLSMLEKQAEGDRAETQRMGLVLLEQAKIGCKCNSRESKKNEE